MKILLTGGGSGGHIMPNIALCEELISHDFSICYMGECHSLEERICKKYSIPFYPISAVKLQRDKLLVNLKIPYLLSKSILKAKSIIKSLDVDIIFSKGGYVSLPTCIAGKMLGIPIVTHESDETLGLANRLIAPIATLLITNTDNIKHKHVRIGNPIRSKLLHGNKYEVLESMHYDPSKSFLLFIGGSGGAKAINDFVSSNIDELTHEYNVVHITGKGNNHISKTGYLGVEFADNMEDYYALADIVISRSGAGAISEILALQKKSILIPLSSKATRGDQVLNAEKLRKDNLAVVLKEEDLDYENFTRAINKTTEIRDLANIYDMNTNRKIVEAIVNVASTSKLKKTRSVTMHS